MRAGLLKSIIEMDITSTMTKLEYMELHFVVGKLLAEPSFAESAEQALTIAKERLTKISQRSDKQTNLLFIFRNKLFLIYQKGGTEAIPEIDNLDDPRSTGLQDVAVQPRLRRISIVPLYI